MKKTIISLFIVMGILFANSTFVLAENMEGQKPILDVIRDQGDYTPDKGTLRKRNLLIIFRRIRKEKTKMKIKTTIKAIANWINEEITWYTSKRVLEAINNGLPYDEVVAIVKEEARK